MVESNVCVSCLSTESIFNIFDTHECEGNEEMYSEMLKFCFDISISPESAAKYMCQNCILILRNAYFFKQDVIRNANAFELQAAEVEYLEMVSVENLQDLEMRDDYVFLDIEDDTFSPEINDLKSEESIEKSNFEEGVKRDENLKDCEESFEVSNSEESIKSEEDLKVSEQYFEINNIQESTQKEENAETKARKVVRLKEPSRIVKVQTKTDLNEKNPDGVLTCPHCPKSFSNKEALVRHSKVHLEGPFSCGICGQVFSKYNSRSSHMWRVHKTKAPYICSECGERFTTFHSRLDHLKKAHNIKPEYECPHCDKTFIDTSSRWRHVRSIHMGVRRHKCAHCVMAFFKRRELLNHMASVHDIGEKPHACEICNKSFFLRGTLVKHLQTHVNSANKHAKATPVFPPLMTSSPKN